MRIGGKAPGGGPILSVGISAMFEYGFPPPRIVNRQSALNASASAEYGENAVLGALSLLDGMTPSSVSPVVTKRQSAIISLRAKATIIVLRVPRRLSAVRTRYHSASALSF